MSRHWMPIFTTQFLSCTSHLGALECGAIMLLMMHKHYSDDLPKDIKHLSRICRVSVRKFKKISDDIMSFFNEKHFGYTNYERTIGLDIKAIARPSIPLEYRQSLKTIGSCSYCGDVDGPFEIDHIIPWSRGGTHEIENLTLACKPCNRSKGAKTISEWRFQ